MIVSLVSDLLYGSLMMGEAASAAGGNPQFNQLQVTGKSTPR